MHSFGIILWQLCSKRVPYNGYTREQLESMIMVGGHRPELLGNIPDTMQRVMTACWNPDPGVMRYSCIFTITEYSYLLTYIHNHIIYTKMLK